MNLLESLPTVIGTAAVAPALLILWLVIAAGERPGHPAKVWTAFVLGAASISLLGAVRAPFNRLLAAPEDPWLGQALHAIFGIALPEETVKILAIVAVSQARRSFSDPINPVVYGAAVGLGFAAYENLAYLEQHTDMWRALAALRSVLTVPFHGALGIIAGAYLAIARSGNALGANRHNRDCDRLRVDRFRGAVGAPRRPPPRAPHRGRPRAPEPAQADVGAPGRGRRRRLHRSRLRADVGASLAA